MLTNLVTFFLPKGLDISNWSAFSQSRYLVYGHLITILIALLGMTVNIKPFDVQPFFVDLALSIIMFSNLFLLKHSLALCRLNFYVIVWVVIFGLATYVNPLFGYEYYFMIWSVSAVMLFTRKLVIYLFFTIGVISFHIPKHITGQTDAEFNYNPPFLFLMLLLIFLVFYSTNKYYVKVINQKNAQLEKDKQLIQHQANRIKQVSSLQTRFFTNISHEFRTPLTLIAGPIKELIDRSNNLMPNQLKHLKTAEENSRRLLNLVEEILDLSKLEAGHITLHVAKTDLVVFIKGIAGTFESLADRKKIDCKFISNLDQCDAWIDKGCLEKIMINLLANAFKYTDNEGTIYITLFVDAKGLAIIEIKDNGRGMSKEHLPYIFERFYHTESDLQGSSGIGLSIVKLLVDRLGANISVESDEGKGSVFTLQFPINKAHWQPEDLIPGHSKITPLTKGHPMLSNELVAPQTNKVVLPSEKDSILVIEDNDDVRLFIEDLLNPDYAVLSAQDGEEGIATALKEIPSLIVCDVMMPVKDGFEVASTLKSNELTSHIPIILLTAKADKDSMLKGLGTAADDYVMKPFDRDELLARISTLLNNRKKLRERFFAKMSINPEDVEVSSMDQQFIKKVLQIIETYLADDSFTVEKLGKEIGMSRSQIHRKLTATIGKSPNQLIKNVRLQRAHDLITKNAATISEIAYMTGFSSPNYFNSCFKDEFGFTPGEVRKQFYS